MNNKDKKYNFNIDRYRILNNGQKVIFICNDECEMFTTNITGYELLKRFDGKKMLSEIINEVAELYDLPYEVVSEFSDKYIQSLIDNGFLYVEEEKKYCKEYKNISRIYIELVDYIGNRLEISLLKKYINELNSISNLKNIEIYLEIHNSVTCEEIDSYLSLFEQFIDSKIIVFIEEEFLDDLIVKSLDDMINSLVITITRQSENINLVEKQLCKYREVFKDNVSLFFNVDVKKYKAREIIAIQQMAYDNGFAGLFIDNMIEVTDTGISNIDKSLTEVMRNNNLLNSWKNNRIKNRSEIFRIHNKEYICKNSFSHVDKKMHCGIGIEELYINCDGKVFPCHKLVDTELFYNNISEYIRNREKDYGKNIIEDKCYNCDAWIMCSGGCKANMLKKNNSFCMTSEYCNNYVENFKKQIN